MGGGIKSCYTKMLPKFHSRLFFLVFLMPVSLSEDMDSGNCRSKKYLKPEVFRLNTCAECYAYMPNKPLIFKSSQKKWHLTNGTISVNGSTYVVSALTNMNITVFANYSDPESPILGSFTNEASYNNWKHCCQQAERCCEWMVSIKTIQNDTMDVYCPRTWDGWQCWNDTLVNITAHSECPSYIYFMTEPPACKQYASKRCLSDGTWYKNDQNNEWSDYSTCSVLDVMKDRVYVHIGAYGVSIITLIPAIIIFFSYKQLKVHRIVLHKNLFFSLLLNAIAIILFKSVVILNELSVASSTKSITARNVAWCKVLFILTKYSRLTNYMWMFCEGFYLHKLIASAFAEQKGLLSFYLIGWVFPVIPVSVYSILRVWFEDERCWVVPVEKYEWVLNLPSLISLILNLFFLINIIRILVTKLRATHANEPSQFRKAVKATVVLLPLFGLHFIVTIYRPSAGICEWIEFYHYLNYLLDGLQGCLVSLIFCYFNGEIKSLMRRSFFSMMLMRSENVRGGNRKSSYMGKSQSQVTHTTSFD